MTTDRISFRTLAADTLGILFFRRPSPAIASHWPVFLAVGLAFAWIAGIGRYWDNPRAELWQTLGLGSVAYVFALAFLLWLLILPLKPQRWSYRTVLIFVALTAPPAVLYAVPVERFLSLDAAQTTNAWFLAIVAAWRVALLVWFLRAFAQLSRFAVTIATLLPITLIIVALSALNLEHVVFNLMAGNRADTATQNDAAYEVVLLLSIVSIFALLPLIAGYVWAIRKAR